MASLSAIVLAGGKSSRMGQDKALIPIQGIPLLQQICHIALQCTTEVYIVTPHPEKYQHLLPTCQFIQETSLPNERKAASEPPHGPLVGFAQGLAHIRTDWVLLLACDLPQLRIETLQQWSEKLAEAPEQAIALLPQHPKGWEPLCGFYRRNCLPALTHFIQQGGRSFQPWLAQNFIQTLPVIDLNMLYNCNTPEDLVALEINNKEKP